MTAYYNEFDPFAAAWLRELIKEGHIADGYVDDRSILDIKAHEIIGFSQHHFFAGIGIWSLALRHAGVPDDEPIWTASCPCQPFSQTGKQMGNADSRHLFPTFRKLAARFGPARIIGEQVASKLGREWLARVRLEMATLGYATRATDLCSAGVAAPNIRQRLYWLADADGGKPWNGRVQSSGEYGQLAEDGGIGGMGDAMRERRNEGSGLNGEVGGTGRGKSKPAESSGGFRGLGDSNCNGAQRTGAGECQLNAASEILQLGHPHSPRSQGRDERGHSGDERIAGAAGLAGGMEQPASNGRQQRWPESGGRSTVSGRRDGYWSRFDILHCTDGKSRRIEPGSFPLAHGVPGRVGKLRGYGNAINVELAAAFLQAACPEICRTANSDRGMVTHLATQGNYLPTAGAAEDWS